MAIDIDKILERIRDVDIKGISRIERITGGKDNQPVIELRFLTIKGALKNSPEENYGMIIRADDPEKNPDDLKFFVPKLNTCEPFSRDITVYMDANWNTIFGAHKWDSGDGEIRFSYLMPLPPDSPEHPDTPLLQRMLKDMYEGMLFHDSLTRRWAIDEDVMLDDDQKKAKKERIDDITKQLLGPRLEDKGAV